MIFIIKNIIPFTGCNVRSSEKGVDFFNGYTKVKKIKGPKGDYIFIILNRQIDLL